METTSFGTVQTGTRCGTHPEVTGSVGVSNLLIRSVFNDHNEEMGPGSGISDLENPHTLKKIEISECQELGLLMSDTLGPEILYLMSVRNRLITLCEMSLFHRGFRG